MEILFFNKNATIYWIQTSTDICDWLNPSGWNRSHWMNPSKWTTPKAGQGWSAQEAQRQHKAAGFVEPQQWSDQNGQSNDVAHPKLTKYVQTEQQVWAGFSPNIPTWQLRMPRMLRQVKWITLVLIPLFDLNRQIYYNFDVFLSIIYICLVFLYHSAKPKIAWNIKYLLISNFDINHYTLHSWSI